MEEEEGVRNRLGCERMVNYGQKPGSFLLLFFCDLWASSFK
jgi:hypothetical protein